MAVIGCGGSSPLSDTKAPSLSTGGFRVSQGIIPCSPQRQLALDTIVEPVGLSVEVGVPLPEMQAMSLGVSRGKILAAPWDDPWGYGRTAFI